MRQLANSGVRQPIANGSIATISAMRRHGERQIELDAVIARAHPFTLDRKVEGLRGGFVIAVRRKCVDQFVSTILPMCWLVSISACAAAASRSGKVL